MKTYNTLWRFFVVAGIAAIAIQQMVCADFRPVLVPPGFPTWLTPRLFWTWAGSIALLAACVCMGFNLQGRAASLVVGVALLLCVLLFHVPYQLTHNPAQLGSWTDPLKCLALSGGAFIMAQTFQKPRPAIIRPLEKGIPLAIYFLGFMLVVFGVDHFLYTDFVATLVPAWMPMHLFWTYVAGVALIAAGLALILNIKRRLAAALLGVMLFIWFAILHLPRAIADPHSGNGNEWTSVFEALAFSGMAFLIASKPRKKALGASKNRYSNFQTEKTSMGF